MRIAPTALIAVLLTPVAMLGVPQSSAAPAPSAVAREVARAAPLPARTYTGEGDGFIRKSLRKRPALLTFTSTNQSEEIFFIQPLFRDGGTGAAIVLEAGARTARTAWLPQSNDDSVIGFKVEATQAWRIKISDLRKARVWRGRAVSGVDNDVIRLRRPTTKPTRVRLSYKGSAPSGGNFMVKTYSGGVHRKDLINYVGDATQATVKLPPGTDLVTVSADGAWSLARRR